MRDIIIYVLAFFFLISCNDDDGEDKIDTKAAEIIVINEGNFGFGNASLSLYDRETMKVENKLFQSNNLGRPIGDVLQSAYQIDNYVYLIVNNSSKIEVVDVSSFRSIGNIAPINSPRYMLPVDTNRSYISDLYEDKIYIINHRELKILNTIPTKGWVEELAIVNQKVFACHVDSSQVWVFDPSTDQVIAKINTNHSPQHIEVDKDDNIWVSCSGGFEEDLAALYKINSVNHQVEKVFLAKDSTLSFGEMEINKNKDQLFYLSNGGIYTLDITDSALSEQAFIAANNRTFYGLSLDPKTDEIYVCDAIDYQQHGVVFRYDANGTQLDVFTAGVIPSDVFFLNQ